MLSPEQAIELAWHYSIPEPNTGCWLWVGNTAGSGEYPVISVGRSRYRYICRAILGLTDRHIEALHRCDTPRCANPGHLYRGDQRENLLDASRKKRLLHAAKTHCPSGHPYTRVYHRAASASRGATTQRICVICESEGKRQRRVRARARRHLTRDG